MMTRPRSRARGRDEEHEDHDQPAVIREPDDDELGGPVRVCWRRSPRGGLRTGAPEHHPGSPSSKTPHSAFPSTEAACSRARCNSPTDELSVKASIFISQRPDLML